MVSICDWSSNYIDNSNLGRLRLCAARCRDADRAALQARQATLVGERRHRRRQIEDAQRGMRVGTCES